MTEEEANQVRENNDKIRKERDEICDKIATKFACFKRDFMGAPIWRVMKAILDKKTEGIKPCQINYRKDERLWVFPSA